MNVVVSRRANDGDSLTVTKIKQPYFFEADRGKTFAFAGLWEWWRQPGIADAPALESCTLLTGEPNELQAEVHDRMPISLTRLTTMDGSIRPMRIGSNCWRCCC